MKEPHNYRIVGYSMIVISVSLTVIGLVVWAIGNDYHFGSNLMAGQEVDAMTPKQGYNIVLFDHTAPVGAKLKLLDYTNSINDTMNLQTQYQQSANGLPILIFGNNRDYNVDLMAHSEVSSLTPIRGYNVIFFNNAMPVGAKLSMNIHDDSLVNATKHQQQQKDANKDPDISVIIFGSSYQDNLMAILGSGTSITAVNAPTIIQTTTTSGNQTTTTSGNQTTTTSGNQTTTTSGNQTTTTSGNQTTTTSGNQTTTTSGNQTISDSKKSINLSENVGIAPK